MQIVSGGTSRPTGKYEITTALCDAAKKALGYVSNSRLAERLCFDVLMCACVRASIYFIY